MSKYYEDPSTRKKIDALLEMNACIQANLGTKSKFDMVNPGGAEQLWYQFLVEIKSLDPEFYVQIASNEEKEMVEKKIYSKRRFRNAVVSAI